MSNSSPVPLAGGDALSPSAHTAVKARDPHEAECHCVLSSRSRNLVVCIDGTASQFSQNVRTTFFVPSNFLNLAQNTNVIEFYSRLKKDEKQLTYYNSGIGTYGTKLSRSSLHDTIQFFRHLPDLFFALCVFKVLSQPFLLS